MNEVCDVDNRTNIVLKIENVEQLLEQGKITNKGDLECLGLVGSKIPLHDINWGEIHEKLQMYHFFWFTNFVSHETVSFCIFIDILVSE